MTQVREIVDKMFTAFGTQNVDAVIETFADNAELVYHGTKIMPSARFTGKEGARMFFEFNISALEVVYFNVSKYTEEGDTVVVTGNEHFISKENGSHLKNQWVQIYTVTDGLISKMEEFATSAQPEDYAGNAS